MKIPREIHGRNPWKKSPEEFLEKAPAEAEKQIAGGKNPLEELLGEIAGSIPGRNVRIISEENSQEIPRRNPRKFWLKSLEELLLEFS